MVQMEDRFAKWAQKVVETWPKVTPATASAAPGSEGHRHGSAAHGSDEHREEEHHSEGHHHGSAAHGSVAHRSDEASPEEHREEEHHSEGHGSDEHPGSELTSV